MEKLIQFLSDINWLVTFIIGIGLSILANLLTPPVQNWMAGRSQKSAERRIKIVQKELGEMSRFATDSTSLNSYLILGLMIVILSFAVTNVLNSFHSSLMYTAWKNDITSFLSGGTQGLIIALNLTAMRRVIEAVRVYKRVINFDVYKVETNALLSKLEELAARNDKSKQ